MSRTQEESGATFSFGIITAVDAARGWARARLPEYDNLETAFLPVLQRRTHRDHGTATAIFRRAESDEKQTEKMLHSKMTGGIQTQKMYHYFPRGGNF